MQLQNSITLKRRNSILRLEMCDLIHVDQFVRGKRSVVQIPEYLIAIERKYLIQQPIERAFSASVDDGHGQKRLHSGTRKCAISPAHEPKPGRNRQA